ncbi:hypothetical protein O988_03193 [Pseudogymnoascus sp. VKM F-3808]|nr:hypothetical protein O988_03193 [Pseudogymnoascus sp. VKM F-3808]
MQVLRLPLFYDKNGCSITYTRVLAATPCLASHVFPTTIEWRQGVVSSRRPREPSEVRRPALTPQPQRQMLVFRGFVYFYRGSERQNMASLLAVTAKICDQIPGKYAKRQGDITRLADYINHGAGFVPDEQSHTIRQKVNSPLDDPQTRRLIVVTMSIPKPDGPDTDIGPPMLALCWTLYSVALLVVIARVYTQQQITRQFGLGDYFMLSSIVGVSHSTWIEHSTINLSKAFGLMHISFLTVSHRFGLGRHFFYLSDYLRVKAMEWEFIAEPFGALCSMCGRISFIILLFQLFGTTTFRRWLFYFLAAQTLIVNLVTCITIYTQCENVETIWDPVGTPSKCWSPAVQADIGFFQGASNSATDLILTLIPVTIFFSLQMKLRLKIGLGALLCLSIFAFASSIVKTVKLKTIGDKSDYSHNTVPFMNWVVVENTFVIIGASIPLIRPLFTRSRDHSLTAYIANTPYEMNSRSQSGTNGTSSAPQHKGVVPQTSSEENILPFHGGLRRATNIESTNSLGSEHDTKIR